MTPKKSDNIKNKKSKIVSELKNLMKNKRTTLIISIKNIPMSQYQKIVKKLRGVAEVRVAKKNLITKAIDELEDYEFKRIKDYIEDNFAIIFSDKDAFEISEKLLSETIPMKAKVGQEAPSDVEIPAGPTGLVPGQIVSELGRFKIPIQIEKGKITIKEPTTIIKKGQQISQEVAELLNKLNIKPFFVSPIPIVSFDNQEKRIYINIKIDKKKTLEEMIELFKKATGLAFSINYISKETISWLIRKAALQAEYIKKTKREENI
ncbi:MAG: 50S ribosomal protein L10 [Candidatus Pacearchaeota archaeon]